MPRCPGQDLRFWTPKDIYDVTCFACGTKIEFWKDEPMRVCPSCGKEVRNPRIDLGCAKWCKFAKECLGQGSNAASPVAPVIDRLELLLDHHFHNTPEVMKRGRRLHNLAETFIAAEKAEPCIVQCSALITGAIMDQPAVTPAAMDNYKAMLIHSGVHESVAAKICETINRALSGTPDDSNETVVLNDLITIEKITKFSDKTDQSQLASKLRTQTAIKLAHQRFGL